ncbi:MAG TPA: iron-siderophore ABC transporter substrate-binding protein [Bosea sp. (in: a-proteobacteria)]|jgi:iron complex transport system substrate-binding protein|nr:iron-siderophore ABC transporter substrate-binding protein [Bosea sp. (in: a-proteobacteria)]
MLRSFALLLFLMLAFPPAVSACDGRLVSDAILGPPVCIPRQPQRIVALDPLLTLGILQELEVPIVATPYAGIQGLEVRKAAQAASVADLGHPLQPSLERLLLAKPDLIIGSADMHGAIHETVSRIAPTLLLQHMDWKRHVMLLAEITGRSDAGLTALRGYEQRVAGIRARVPNLAVSVARVRPGGFNIYLDGPAAYAPYAVLREAGVRRTAYETTTGNTVAKRADWEEVAALDGAILLYTVVSGLDPGPDEALAASTVANPLWQMLPAVRTGRAHRVDRGTWMGFHGVASAHRVLDDIERLILTTP